MLIFRMLLFPCGLFPAIGRCTNPPKPEPADGEDEVEENLEEEVAPLAPVEADKPVVVSEEGELPAWTFKLCFQQGGAYTTAVATSHRWPGEWLYHNHTHNHHTTHTTTTPHTQPPLNHHTQPPHNHTYLEQVHTVWRCKRRTSSPMFTSVQGLRTRAARSRRRHHRRSA